MSKVNNKIDPLLGDEEVESKNTSELKKPVANTEIIIPKEKKSASESYLGTIEETKKILENSPHTNFIIPLMEGEEAGSYDNITINGYATKVEKGVMTNIPIQVAKILMEKYKIGLEAGKDMRINRSNDVTNALT